MDKKIIQHSLLHALATFAYITGVATLMQNAQRLFGPGSNRTLAPIAFLTLFVASAAITGGLVFGRPVALYLDGKKKEGMHMAVCTVSFLVIFAIVVFLVLVATR